VVPPLFVAGRAHPRGSRRPQRPLTLVRVPPSAAGCARFSGGGLRGDFRQPGAASHHPAACCSPALAYSSRAAPVYAVVTSWYPVSARMSSRMSALVGYTICWMFAHGTDPPLYERRTRPAPTSHMLGGSSVSLPFRGGAGGEGIHETIRNLAGRYSAVHIP
jgi:hypothetical protein